MFFPGEGRADIAGRGFAGERIGRGHFYERIVVSFFVHVGRRNCAVAAEAAFFLPREEIRNIDTTGIDKPAPGVGDTRYGDAEVFFCYHSGNAPAYRTQPDQRNLHAISSSGSMRSRDFCSETRLRMAIAASMSFLLAALIVILDEERALTAGMLMASSLTSANPVVSIWSTVSERSVCMR